MYKGNRVKFLVKWLGYDNPKDNSWVWKEDCNCPDLIAEFETAHDYQREVFSVFEILFVEKFLSVTGINLVRAEG